MIPPAEPAARLALSRIPGLGSRAGERSRDSPRGAGPNPSPFGVNLHKAVHLMAPFAAIGVGWFRIDVNWVQIETHPGRYAWEEIDALAAEAERLGVALLACVAYTPGWASAGATHTSPPRDVGLYAQFVSAFAARYRRRVAALSVWNEPDLEQFWKGTRQQFLALLQAGLRAAFDAGPEILRCGPELSRWSGSNRKFLQAVLDLTDADPRGLLLDVVTHHQYQGRDTVAGRVKEIEALHAYLEKHDRHRRPLWITETGWNTGQASPEQVAVHLDGLMRAMLARRAWWARTFWYDAQSKVEDGRPGRWGLLGPEGEADAGQPSPAFHAYARVIAAPR